MQEWRGGCSACLCLDDVTVDDLFHFCVCSRLELVFAEERKRASERIIEMTKDHEQKMKQVILAMDLGS